MPYILQSVVVCNGNPPKDAYIAIDLGPMDFRGGLIDCREAGYSDEDYYLVNPYVFLAELTSQVDCITNCGGDDEVGICA